MGDRSNIVIASPIYATEDGGVSYKKTGLFDRVYLYAHCLGQDIMKSAVHGLRSGRNTDDSYLARVIFCHMVKGQEDEETSFGISATLTDNEYPIFVIVPSEKHVFFESEDGAPLTNNVSYAKFLELASRQSEDSYNYVELIGAMQ
jgi:hypothetical protein